ncbi:MAG: hypothetical protein ACI4UM_00320 [Succinivibrio sp.]
MIYLASFLIFILFAFAMCLSLIMRKKPLVSEEEATASIMDGGACATCTQMCAMAGKKTEKPKKGCKIKDMEIPHQDL